MENAVNALKMAFAVFAFIMAISLSIFSFNMAKRASDVILYSKDETNYYEYQDGSGNENRIVGIETIIPTLYRYYKEDYRVEFYKRNSNGTKSELYLLKLKSGKSYNYFDLNDEYNRNEPWKDSIEEIEKNLKAFINGGKYKSPVDGSIVGNYSSFLENYKDYKFIETLKIEKKPETVNGVTKDKERRIIVYTRIS